MSALTDALGFVGSAISAPGDYTRGLLAGQPGERMGGRDLLRHYGLAGQDDNWGNFLGGMATDIATDPLTYLTAGLGSGAGSAAAKGVRGMIPLVAEDAAGAGARAAGGLAKFREPLRDVTTLRNATSEAAGGIGDFVKAGNVGGYDPTTRTMFNAAGLDSKEAAKTLRHERVHGIIDQASQGVGNVNDLPAIMRYPAKMKASDSPLMQSVGTLGDELAAQTLENRTLPAQLQGAASYLFNPTKNAAYADAFAAGGVDPRVVGAYRYLPKGMIHAGAAGGAGAGAGANYLTQALLGQ